MKELPLETTDLIDDEGVNLVANWIGSLKPAPEEPTSSQSKPRPLDTETSDELIETQLDSNFANTSTAIELAIQLSRGEFSNDVEQKVAEYAAKHPKQEIRELFERFLLYELRKKRLGNAIDVELLLSIKGDIERGRKLYFETELTCKTCHQIGGKGAYVGPDLSAIGATRKPNEILESIMDPSGKIEEKFQGKIVVTIDGEVISELLIAGDTKNANNLVDSTGKKFTIPHDEVEEERVMPKSMMPEQLLAEMTLQEAVDLLSFLNAQKDESKTER